MQVFFKKLGFFLLAMELFLFGLIREMGFSPNISYVGLLSHTESQLQASMATEFRIPQACPEWRGLKGNS